MTCSSCPHPSCAHSLANQGVMPCPECGHDGGGAGGGTLVLDPVSGPKVSIIGRGSSERGSEGGREVANRALFREITSS